MPAYIEDGLLVRSAVVQATASGNTTLVAAAAGYRVRVIFLWLMIDADCKIYFVDTGGTAVCGGATAPMSFLEEGGVASAECIRGVMETADDTGLVLNLSTNGPVAGVVRYVLDPTS